jgi:thiol:disulfide interchange protein DsbC
MKIKSNITLVIATLLSMAPGLTFADDQGKSFNDLIPEYDSIRRLPIDGINMVEVDGRIIYTSTNGRFVFTNAELYDTFNRKRLTTASEIADYSKRLNLDAMGIDRGLIGSVALGSGSKQVTMFIDPMCGYCSKMLSQVINNPDLYKTYTFNVVGIPILGEQSASVLRNLICAYKNNEVDAGGFVATLANKSYSGLKNYTATCDDGNVERAIITAKLLGAKGVPFVVSSTGKYMNSMPSDIEAFLKESEG